MADEILVKYIAEVDGFRAELKQLKEDLKSVETTSNTSASASTAAFNKTSKSVNDLHKQINEIYKSEQDLLKQREKTNDPAKIAAYNKKIAEARFEQRELSNEIKRTEQASNQAAKAGSSMVSQFKSVATAIGIAFGVAQIVSFSKEAFNLASKAEGIKTAFSRIGGEETLQKLRLATRGATSDLELMQAALRGQNFGISTDLLAKGLELAGKVARTTGQDVTYLTNSFVDGLGRKSIRILDNLQISQVDLQKEIKKTGDFNTAVGNIVEKKLKEMGEVVDTTADKVARFTSFWENLKVSFGENFIKTSSAVIDFFDALFTSTTFAENSTKHLLESNTRFYKKFNGDILEEAKESEQKRTKLLLESTKRLNEASRQLRQEDGEILSKQDFEQTKNILENEKQLNSLLRNLNKKHQQELTDDELKAIAKREKEKKDLRIKLLEELLALVQKTEEEAIRSSAKTDQEKLNQDRDFAELAARDARDAAIQSGTDKAVADAAYHQIVLNNNKIFAEKQADIDKKSDEDHLKNTEQVNDQLAKMDKDLDDIMAKNFKKFWKDKEDIAKRAAASLRALEQQSFSDTVTAINLIGQIQQNETDQQIQNVNEVRDAEVSALDAQLSANEITRRQYDERKAAADKKAHDQEAALKRKAFESQKQISLITTVINTAEAVVKALASLAYPYNLIAAASVAALGALQISVIESQPTPKFAKGGKVKGRMHKDGGTMVEAEDKEWIIKRSESIKNDRLLDAVNSGSIDKFIFTNYIAPALKAQQRKLSDQRDSSFAQNIANSMLLNSQFKDGNLLDSLKQSRKNDREIAIFLAKELKGNSHNARRW